MNRSLRGPILGSAALVLLGLVGCGENNEARVESGGVTPPGAGASSEDGLKAKPETKSANPYKGMGPKSQPGRKAAPTPAPESKTESTPETKS
jgi:hypothetical protein